MNDFIPMARWGRDHWSTLLYIESVMVDGDGLVVRTDPRMRANRQHFLAMAKIYPRHREHSNAVVMPEELGSRLKDGSEMKGHDDWCCVQDFAQEGLLQKATVNPGEKVLLSDKGFTIVYALRKHLASGGKTSEFQIG